MKSTWMICLLLLAASGGAESPVPEASEIYLRVANLMPLGPGRAEIQRGGQPFLSGMKPGFFMPYQALEKKDSWQFQVLWEGRPLGEFEINPSKPPAFYTVVLMEKQGKAHLEFTRDDPDPPQEGEFSLPSRRLRAFLPSMGFPYKVEAGQMGTWEVHRESMILDLPVDVEPPAMVRLAYTTRDGDEVELFFPLDFEAHPRNAIFVSQRGIQRPRLRCWPDNVPPMDAAEDMDATPLPAFNP